MIPALEDDLSEDYEVEMEPSLTWKLNANNGHIRGTVDQTDAVSQAIYCILNTESYDTLVYSWDFGVELKDLYGEPLGYVLPELERRITEALIQDDRIESVGDFQFDTSRKGVVAVSFSVESSVGKVQGETEVDI